jgi:diketogulonate reductase-like aldo/keto reductase
MGNFMFWLPANKHHVQPQEFRIPVFLSSINKNIPVLLNDPVLCDMAKKHKKTPALIALRYQLQRGVVVLAKSFKEHRIKENMQVMRSLSVRLLCL